MSPVYIVTFFLVFCNSMLAVATLSFVMRSETDYSYPSEDKWQWPLSGAPMVSIVPRVVSAETEAGALRCPKCGKRIGFNERGTTCPKCGAWLLSRQPSEHALEHMRRGGGKDDFLNDFPWVGGTPGRRAMAFTAIWIVLLVVLAVSILLSFITMHFLLAFVLIILTAAVGVLPTLFLVGSRI